MTAVDDAANVLADHRWTVRAGGATCGCGEEFGWLSQHAVVAHRRHVAQALADAGLLRDGTTRPPLSPIAAHMQRQHAEHIARVRAANDAEVVEP